MSARPATGKGNLLRLGFQDADAALADLAAARAGRRAAAGAARPQTADPDAALAGLVRLARRGGGRRGAASSALVDDEGTAMRLLCVLGASEALADHLVRHPEHWRELTDPTARLDPPGGVRRSAPALLRPSAPTPTPTVPTAAWSDAEAVDALRVEYRRVLLRLAARDLAHDLGVDDAAAELSDLAAGTLEAALAIARARGGGVGRPGAGSP